MLTFDLIKVQGLLDEPWLSELREACNRVLERARAGPDDPKRWKYVRAVGKQFPPFPPDRDDIWGVQHLMHPDLQEPIFLEWYTSPKLLATVSEIIGAEEDDLQLELFNLLVNPQQIPYSLSWHRDNVRYILTHPYKIAYCRPEASAEEELKELKKPCFATQWNAALYDDQCLIVVPGSHRRARTREEREVNLEGDARGVMPGYARVFLLHFGLQIADCLKNREKHVLVPVGSVLFYDHNILHRAVYPTSPERGMYKSPDSSPEANEINSDLTWLYVVCNPCWSGEGSCHPPARFGLDEDDGFRSRVSGGANEGSIG